MAKTKEWKRTVSWKCLVCEGNPEFEHSDMMKHMREVHGFEPKTTKATKSALMCLDGQGFYQNTFEYEVNGMKFLKYDSGQRE
jgi:hypothetical protein